MGYNYISGQKHAEKRGRPERYENYHDRMERLLEEYGEFR